MPPKRTPPPQARTELLVPTGRARSQIEERIAIGRRMLAQLIGPVSGLLGTAMQNLESTRDKWAQYNEELLRRLFTDDVQAKAYVWSSPPEAVSFEPFARHQGPPPARTREILEVHIQFLESLIDRLELFQAPPDSEPALSVEMGATRTPIDKVEHLANRFHVVARQLRSRHGNRSTLEISDEYDVQDLLHALLRLEFDDVRPEEHAPNYAGGSSRMDFLLKAEQIVVEVKCTRDGLGAKEIGEQLLIDIAKYQSHPDCRNLLCFVYDPMGRVGNPRGLESDLSHDRHGLPTRVFIRPRF